MAALGIIDIFWNGNKVPNEPGGTVKLGGVRNKEVIFSRSVAAAGAMMASEISCNAIIQTGDRVTDNYGTGTGELQVHCDTGQIFSWDDAFIVEAIEFTAGEGGNLKLMWRAGTPTEV
jgi:hypothetical protein